MKQLGNLAIICAKRSDTLMQLYYGTVFIYLGTGPHRINISVKWDDDIKIKQIIYELNHGKYAEKRKENKTSW